MEFESCPLCNLVRFSSSQISSDRDRKLLKSTKLPVGKDQDEINKQCSKFNSSLNQKPEDHECISDVLLDALVTKKQGEYFL